MSKSCCFAVVLAVICLSVILLSLEAEAQSTIDETMTCSSSTLEEVVNMVKMITLNHQQHSQEMKKEIKDEIKDVKSLLVPGTMETNETRLEEVVNMVKVITSNQQQHAQEMKNEIKDV